MSTTTISPSIPREHIEATLESLPIQNRTMIRLLLLQYQDLKPEEIEYMANDQPDSRFMAGAQPTSKPWVREAVREVGARAEQYHLFLRQKRERPWLQIECLNKQLELTDSAIHATEGLLATRFQADPVTIKIALSRIHPASQSFPTTKEGLVFNEQSRRLMVFLGNFVLIPRFG